MSMSQCTLLQQRMSKETPKATQKRMSKVVGRQEVEEGEEHDEDNTTQRRR